MVKDHSDSERGNQFTFQLVFHNKGSVGIILCVCMCGCVERERERERERRIGGQNKADLVFFIIRFQMKAKRCRISCFLPHCTTASECPVRPFSSFTFKYMWDVEYTLLTTLHDSLWVSCTAIFIFRFQMKAKRCRISCFLPHCTTASECPVRPASSSSRSRRPAGRCGWSTSRPFRSSSGTPCQPARAGSKKHNQTKLVHNDWCFNNMRESNLSSNDF